LLKIYDWFSKNRFWNICLIIVYYLLVVLPHEEVGQFLAKNLDEPLGRIRYNQLVLFFGILGTIAYLKLNGVGIKKYPKRRKIVLLYLFFTFLFIFIAFKFLMVVNVEMIHLVQYGLLTLLLFPLFCHFGSSLFFAIILGALDEAYQYWVLTPLSTDYYDFNDVIINLLGAALGLILLYSNGLQTKQEISHWFPSPIIFITLFTSLLLIILYNLEIFAIFPKQEGIQAPLLLIRRLQSNFWTVGEHDIKFHVIRPFSGLILGIILYHFYRSLDTLSNRF